MKKILTILFLILPFDLFAELSCSANGLNILYINGVNVPLIKDAQNSSSKIDKLISPIQSDLDKKKLFSTKTVYNSSRGLLNDIEELKSQLAANHQGKKRDGYWKVFANLTYTPFNNTKEFDEALSQITSGANIPLDKSGKVIDQDFYSKTDFYKDLAIYNSKLANLLANASSDVAVITEMKTQIKNAYNKGANKVIIVSHSQGNEVAYSAVNDLRRDRTFLASDGEIKKFDGLMGYVQVAPPSPRLITSTDSYFNYYYDHAQYIRADADMVIGNSAFITGTSPVSANYYTSSIVNGVAKLFDASSGWWEKLLAPIYSGGTALYHGMDDIYLSSSFYARRENTILPKSMAEHFKDNMREIASKLQDNCYDFDVSLSAQNAFSKIVNNVSYSSQISGDLNNGFRDGGIFPWQGIVQFNLILSDGLKSINSLMLYNVDTGAILYDGSSATTPSTISFNYTYKTGGDYIINLLLVAVDSNKNPTSDPILKTIKLHLSPRQKVTPMVAECAEWQGPDKVCFNLNGTMGEFGFGFKLEGVGSLDVYQPIGDPYVDHMGAGFLWTGEGTDKIYNPDGTIYSGHIRIFDNGGIIFDGVLTNPCKINTTFTCGYPIIPL